MRLILEVEKLSFGFGSRKVLNDISFAIAAGESVAIMGANGAGKSTLLWCVLGLLRAQGAVRLFGQKPGKKTHSRVGMVFQNPEDQLFMPTLLDDIVLPLVNAGMPRGEAELKAIATLQRAGLDEYAPEPAAHLSLGQRKRAAIASVLAREPELLVLDEPTAELDGRSVRELGEMLLCLPMARIMASHDLNFVRRVAKRILVIDAGTLITDGPAERVLADSALLSAAGLI